MTEYVPRHELLVVGRLCVDLYGEQEGETLEDTRTFTKSVGGSAGNIAVGAARLGIRTAILSRVGDEALGRFLQRSLAEAGVDTSGVIVDEHRLTGVVMLAQNQGAGYPRVFLYENAADLALSPHEIDESLLAETEAVLITGSILATPQGTQAVQKLVDRAKETGLRLILDIDYRPVLWNVAGHDDGAAMFVDHPAARERLRQIIGGFDLIVGTEEEVKLLGGAETVIASLKAIRTDTNSVLVLKRGSRGSVAFPGPVPDQLDSGVMAPALMIDAVNPVGAGDAFLAGFVRAWIRGEALERSLWVGNVCGAIVASRVACSAAMPSWFEVEEVVSREEVPRRLGADPVLRSMHHAAVIGPPRSQLCVLALDHRWQMEEMADSAGADRSRIGALKGLLVQAFREVASQRDDVGILLDDEYAAQHLEGLHLDGAWLGRPIEVGRSRPVSFLGDRDPAVTLRAWPRRHVVKCMVYCHPDDPHDMKEAQMRRLGQLYGACLEADRQLLVELQPPDGRHYANGELATLLEQIYTRGVRPTMWKTPPLADANEWDGVAKVLASQDPRCHGILVLGGSDTTVDQLSDAVAVAAQQPVCRGFAVGRAIFTSPARSWLSGEVTDAELIRQVVANYRALINVWDATRESAREEAT